MLVLGVDPGLARTGYAVVSRGNPHRVLVMGIIRTPVKWPIEKRLQELSNDLSDVIRRYRPVALALEKVYIKGNRSAASAVERATGVVMLTAAEGGIFVTEYSPSTVKKTVTGDGGRHQGSRSGHPAEDPQSPRERIAPRRLRRSGCGRLPPAPPAFGTGAVIGSLRGVLTEKKPEGVTIDVGGVGYEVAMAPSAVENLAGEPGEVLISTHLQVWSEGMRLFGFARPEERDLFRLLISAQGVGPKVGLAILATLGAGTVREAVRSEDVTTFTRVSGVGKKTAQRLILDLRGKLEAAEANVVSGATRSSQLWEALAGLGYRTGEIRRAAAAVDLGDSFEDQLRAALRELAQ